MNQMGNKHIHHGMQRHNLFCRSALLCKVLQRLHKSTSCTKQNGPGGPFLSMKDGMFHVEAPRGICVLHITVSMDPLDDVSDYPSPSLFRLDH